LKHVSVRGKKVENYVGAGGNELKMILVRNKKMKFTSVRGKKVETCIGAGTKN